MTKEENPVLYVILNGELKMSPGKGAAQAVHAAMLLEGNYDGLFVAGYKRTVIVLEAENGDTLKNLLEYCQGAGVFASYYIDEVTEKGKPYQVTALAVEPIPYDDEETRSIFENFPLFRGHVKVRMTDDWGIHRGSVTISGGEHETTYFQRKALKGLNK